MASNINALIRKHLLSSLENVVSPTNADTKIRLDENENPWGSPLTKWYNRSPDQAAAQLKQKIGYVKNADPSQIFLGNGSNEIISNILNAFCEPGIDNVVTFQPSPPSYASVARINNVHMKEVLLTEVFQPDLEQLENVVDEQTKIIFFCSPNDPTGNSIDRACIELVLNNFDGLVVVDEAYINFSRNVSFIKDLADYQNLVILQSFSHAWGLAGLQVAACFAANEIIQALETVRVTAVNTPTYELMLKAMDGLEAVNEMTRTTVRERTRLSSALKEIAIVDDVFKSDANFLLVRFKDVGLVRTALHERGIAVADVSQFAGCANCLRITVGTPDENQRLTQALQTINV